MSGYQIKHETVRVGPMLFTLRVLLDHEQYDDPNGAAQRLGISPDCWSLFGQVWPSGQVLAEAMGLLDVESLRILELGAGLALASLVAHRRGADVTVSDYHPEIPAFLQANLALNGLGPLKYYPADWSAEAVGLGQFDLIIGSDLLYESVHPAMLADFIDRHSADNVDILLVDPDRGYGDAFRLEMAELEYSTRTTRVDRLLDNGERYRGAMLHFSRDERQPVPAR
ncbi:class I SAM-dependent methyltransferase [Stutzerimonas tarimensis]|uniref:Class I SAM-dependent methyltransferase n=1 Tax=Stutzerimonas tarimensis TaxID=1507735 RepID=A0ABV7TE89_9GAMM